MIESESTNEDHDRDDISTILTQKERPTSKDISSQFLSMDSRDFRIFLRSLKDEPELSIEIDWVDVPTARKLKAFLQFCDGQKRNAIVHATKEEHDLELNVFESGVQWEKRE